VLEFGRELVEEDIDNSNLSSESKFLQSFVRSSLMTDRFIVIRHTNDRSFESGIIELLIREDTTVVAADRARSVVSRFSDLLEKAFDRGG